MPAALTPADCDLRDFPFIPLDVRRLRDSDLAAHESAECCWAALLLWCAAWHQIPAASLPDDDRVLANLAGYGRVVSAWLEVKQGALRGFITCDDGRLYHPVVAEKASEAWRGKLEQRWRSECARIKKANQRSGADDPLPSFEEFLASRVPRDTATLSPGTSPSRPQDEQVLSPETPTASPQGQGVVSPPSPSGRALQEKGKGKGTGKESVGGASLTRARPKLPLPPDWRLGDLDRAYAAGKGFVPDDVDRMAERFRNHALQNDRRCASWESAWRNWVLGDVDKRPAPRKAEVIW